ncbi:MAG: twin-arginine translocation signal domain-containing protein, partial [Acidobacteriota bacterium]|nr:twin-arginine translocation signal domain-containing protein [Acidobacteriota bacterium]
MQRREFIKASVYSLGAAWLGSGFLAPPAWLANPLPRKFSAADTATLGNTGIKTSRLAMGTGTVGVGHHSHQTALGVA